MERDRPRSGQGEGAWARVRAWEFDPDLLTLLASGELSLPIKGGMVLTTTA